MRVLVVNLGQTPKLQIAPEALGASHQVAPFEGDARDADVLDQAIQGHDAVVLVAPSHIGHGWQTEFDLLDRATRGTYVAVNAAVKAGVKRIVLISSLALLESYPAEWVVDTSWQPIPDVERPEQLAAFLAEQSAKELARVEPIQLVCLRLGEVDQTERIAAIRAALDDDLTRQERHSTGRLTYGWWVRHAGRRVTRSISSPSANDSAPARPIENIVVFGAGGPLAAAAQPLLAERYRLRLTDLRALDEIVAEAKPQSPGAPLPTLPAPPHDTTRVDVTNYDHVLRACQGMDAAVNCTVLRPDPVLAFHVNTLGAYHVMKAAVASGINRVVHTGPLLALADQAGGYDWDFGITDDAPPRPGNWVYLHSKFLGQEIVRLFAERYALTVPTLLFCNFVKPDVPRRRSGGIGPFTISWADAGQAIRSAVDVPSLPSPFEPFHLLADLPHGKFTNARAKHLLSWQPHDTLEPLYTQRPEATPTDA